MPPRPAISVPAIPARAMTVCSSIGLSMRQGSVDGGHTRPELPRSVRHNVTAHAAERLLVKPSSLLTVPTAGAMKGDDHFILRERDGARQAPFPSRRRGGDLPRAIQGADAH